MNSLSDHKLPSESYDSEDEVENEDGVDDDLRSLGSFSGVSQGSKQLGSIS